MMQKNTIKLIFYSDRKRSISAIADIDLSLYFHSKLCFAAQNILIILPILFQQTWRIQFIRTL